MKFRIVIGFVSSFSPFPHTSFNIKTDKKFCTIFLLFLCSFLFSHLRTYSKSPSNKTIPKVVSQFSLLKKIKLFVIIFFWNVYAKKSRKSTTIYLRNCLYRFFWIEQYNSKKPIKKTSIYFSLYFYSNRIQNYSKNIQMMCRCFFYVPHGRQENLRMTDDWICTRSRTDETVSVSMAFNLNVHTDERKIWIGKTKCVRVYVWLYLVLSFYHLHAHSDTFCSHMLRIISEKKKFKKNERTNERGDKEYAVVAA